MAKDETAAATEGVLAEGTPQGEEGVATEATPQEKPAEGAVPAEQQPVIPEGYVPAEDLNRLKSTLQRQLYEQEQAIQREREALQRRLEEAESRLLHTLTDDERLEYERERDKQQIEILQRQVQEHRWQLEQANMRNQLADYYASKGVPRDQLDYSSPEAMQESAFNYFQRKLARQTATPTRPQAPQAQPAQPPAGEQRVATGTAGTPSARLRRDMNWKDYQELIRRARRGKVNIEDLPQ